VKNKKGGTMKYVFKFLFLFLFLSTLGQAEEQQICLPESEIDKAIALTSGAGSVSCSEKPGEQCICRPKGVDWHEVEKVDGEAPDFDQPIFAAKEDVESCDDEADCQAKLAAKVCTNHATGFSSFFTLSPNEVYCTKQLGYVMVPTGLKALRFSQSKRDAWESSRAAKAADEAAIQAALKASKCGARVKARMLVQNASKSLSNGQKKQLVQTYSDIIQLLDAGSLSTARSEILAVTPDGSLVTSGDKTALVAELDGCVN